MRGLTIRDATSADAPACAAIYAPYVTDTSVSFELVPPDAATIAHRIVEAQETHAWLVIEDGGQIIGYAYGHPYAVRAAYRWSCETSIYLDLTRRGTGAGRLIYTALLERMVQRGYRQAFGIIALPNDASVGLHSALGFEQVGRLRDVGWKHGQWHDVITMQKTLSTEPNPPAEPH